jgi:PAS domain S-box-containing protein
VHPEINEESSTHNVASPRLNAEDEFRLLFELSAVGAAQVSPEGRYVRVNQKYCEMLGYSEQELLHRTVLDVTHPDDREASAVKLTSSFNAGKPEEYSVEKRYIRKDGEIVWALVKWRILRDENGKPIHTVANVEDITARRQAEDALKAREAQLRAIMDNSSAFIFVKDVEGRYLKINRWYELVGGISEAEVRGKTDYVLFPAEIADGLRKNDKEVIAANKPLQFEEQIPLSDGLHHFVCVKFPLSGDDGQPYAVCGIATDITDHKRTEVALQESKERLQLAMEAANVGTWRVDLQTGFLTRDAALNRIVGLAEEPLTVPFMTWFDRIHPDDFPKVHDSWERAKKDGVYDVEHRLAKADGTSMWVRDRGQFFYGPDGTPIYATGATIDITDRKRAETALREKAGLLDLTHDTVMVRDVNDVITFWNHGATEMYGWTAEEAVGQLSHDLLRTSFPEPLSDIKNEMFNSGRWDGELIHCHRDGQRLTVASRWTLQRDDEGRFAGILEINNDISKRKQAEEALQASEQELQAVDERLKLAMEAGEIGTFDWNIRTNEVFWSEPSMATFGTPSGSSQGVYDDWAKRLDPADLQDIHGRFQEVLKNREQHWLAEYRLANDGTTRQRWVRSQGHIFYDSQGEPLRMIGANIDITDRRQAEAEREKLLAREQVARTETEHAAERIRRLQAVTDSTLGHFVLKDFLFETLARVRELIEVDSATILLPTEDSRSLVVRAAVGMDGGLIGRIIPVGQGIAGTIAANRTPLIVEDTSQYKVVNPILRERVRSLIGVPMTVEGRLVGVIHADSFTARHFNDSDLRLLQLAADRIALAIEQARLYEVERQARRQAEEANRMKDEFLALVSHELRSPLNAMLGYARLLRYGPADEKKISRTVDVIERNGNAQIQLIDDLLDTARIISGKLQLHVGPVDLVSMIEGAVQTIYPAADAKDIRIQTDLNPPVDQITGDVARLQQVLWNLLSNSVKFTPRGGRIDIRLERIDPHISITVTDTGKGIQSDFLPYIFDRFRQADASSTRRYGGLGLGLALVKYLVELHGGTVEAFSAGENKGTTFTVLLPVRAVSSPLPAEGAPAASLERPKSTLVGIRALVVDDEEDARELVKTVLSQYGSDVIAACSAAEAFELMTTARHDKRPDVIVCDLGMPEEDGYGLLRRLRNWEQGRKVYTPAVALTAYGRSVDRMRSLMAGFQMHVAKPVEPDELAIVVASVVKHRNRA